MAYRFGRRTGLALVVIVLGCLHLPLLAQVNAELTVSHVAPAARLVAAPRHASISVTFNRAVDRQSVIARQSFWAFGRWSGAVDGEFRFSNGDRTVTLEPQRAFAAGENVMVVLSHDLQAVDGSALRAAGYSWQFWVASRPSQMQFQQISVMTTNIAAESSRPYGGVAADLNRDGWLDLTVVNEDTADLRVFMNRADGTGQLAPFKQPTTAVGNRASPSEPSDFNHDGLVDIAVANIDDNTVSVLLGNGDGSFAPQQLINVGQAPRGIAVLDVDGDGDIDIVNSNAESGDLSLLRNNGDGRFADALSFPGGPGREWALAAADMNEDGLLDLITGAQDRREIVVLANSGDGSFRQLSSVAAGGDVWMLVVGDIDGDRHEDVAAVNSRSNNGAILRGDGAGQLGVAEIYSTDPFPLAVDLGDVDGDGDLDWVSSSFEGDWLLFSNDGAGRLSMTQRFDAPVAASCALLADFDNDADIDLALIDEQADQVFVQSNDGANPASITINAGHSGAWFNPSTSGQGIFLEVLPARKQLLLAWFTFDRINAGGSAQIGEPNHRWLTALGAVAGERAELAINLTQGGRFDTADPVADQTVGTITITFSDCTNGAMEYAYEPLGLSGTIPLTRVADDNTQLCQSLSSQLAGLGR